MVFSITKEFHWNIYIYVSMEAGSGVEAAAAGAVTGKLEGPWWGRWDRKSLTNNNASLICPNVLLNLYFAHRSEAGTKYDAEVAWIGNHLAHRLPIENHSVTFSSPW